MGHDEVRVMKVNIDCKRREEQTGQSADREQPDETHRVEHGRVVGNGTFVESGRPVEDLDRGWNRHQEAEYRKHEACVLGLTRNEHVMSPYQKSDERNGEAGKRHERVAEYALACVSSNQFAHHTHPRQDHDVNGRMRVEPEQVLEKNGISANGRIENAHVPDSLDSNQYQSDRQNRSGQHHDDCRRVV